MPKVEIVVGKPETITLMVEATMNLHDIAGQLNEDEIFNLIVALDEQHAEWSLTNRLWEHFKEQRKLFLKEFPGEEDDTEDSQ